MFFFCTFCCTCASLFLLLTPWITDMIWSRTKCPLQYFKLQVQILLQCCNRESPRKTKRVRYRHFTKSLIHTCHFLFKFSTIVHYNGCCVNHFNLHKYTYRMHCPWEMSQYKMLHWCLPVKESNYKQDF
jgi:hypothetical protein